MRVRTNGAFFSASLSRAFANAVHRDHAPKPGLVLHETLGVNGQKYVQGAGSDGDSFRNPAACCLSIIYLRLTPDVVVLRATIATVWNQFSRPSQSQTPHLRITIARKALPTEILPGYRSDSYIHRTTCLHQHEKHTANTRGVAQIHMSQT